MSRHRHATAAHPDRELAGPHPPTAGTSAVIMRKAKRAALRLLAYLAAFLAFFLAVEFRGRY